MIQTGVVARAPIVCDFNDNFVTVSLSDTKPHSHYLQRVATAGIVAEAAEEHWYSIHRVIEEVCRKGAIGGRYSHVRCGSEFGEYPNEYVSRGSEWKRVIDVVPYSDVDRIYVTPQVNCDNPTASLKRPASIWDYIFE